jgi:hypothetical protein
MVPAEAGIDFSTIAPSGSGSSFGVFVVNKGNDSFFRPFLCSDFSPHR